MNKILVLFLVVFLASGCAGNPKRVLSVQEKQVVVMPSDAQFRCPELPIVPENIDNLMDTEVADYLLQLYESGKICRDSLEGVKQFLIDAQKGIDKAQPKE